jgi:hypothetical protein
MELTMSRKCIAKLMNKKTKSIYALVDNGNDTFSVLKLCENYNGQVKGGISKTWRYVVSNVDKIAAKHSFYNKVDSLI